MSEEKPLFESAPDIQGAFSKLPEERSEKPESTSTKEKEDEPQLEYKPPTQEFGFQSVCSLETAPAVWGKIDAEKESAPQSKSNDSQLTNDYLLSNPIKTKVCLSEAWEKAQLHDNGFDEGAEK